jgi:DNA-binding FadR family transcriptional regulator
LVRQLGVSRPVIREAMIALEIARLVEARRGGDIYVCGLPRSVQGLAADLAEIAPFDIFDARLAVEGEVAAVAAEHATAADLTEMVEAIEQMRLGAQPGRSTKPANQRFHLVVAVATRNPCC